MRGFLSALARGLGSMFEASLRASEVIYCDDLDEAPVPPIRADERCRRSMDGEPCMGFTRYEDDHAWGFHRSDCPGLADMRAYTDERRGAAA